MFQNKDKSSQLGEINFAELLTTAVKEFIIITELHRKVKYRTEDINMNFADKLRKLRTEKELTQEQLAQETGITRRSVIKYELGEARPHSGTNKKLADFFGIDPEILADDNAGLPQISGLDECYIEEIRGKYGDGAARGMAELFEANAAFFAGGNVPQEEKDKFITAMKQTYLRCREEAEARYGSEYVRTEEEKM